jgi:streptogrisin C
MRKHQHLLSIALAGMTTLYGSNQAFAEDLSLVTTPSAKAFDQDAEQYSQDYRVLYSEALRRLIIQNSSGEIVQQLESEFKNRLAGIYFEHEPNYKLIVVLTGNAPILNRNVVLKNNTTVSFAGSLVLPIEFKVGAKLNRSQLIRMIEENHINLKKAFPNIQAISINEKDGTLDVELYEPNGVDLSARSQKTALRSSDKPLSISNLPLTVQTTNILLQPSAAVRASESMLMTETATSTTYYKCTTGFNIKDSTGKKYSTTAAHCKNAKITVDDRKTTVNDQISLNFLKEFWNGSQDFQVMSLASASHTLNPEFFAGDNVVKTLVGRRSRASTNAVDQGVQGDYVCHYGVTTGYSCGTVQSKTFKPYGTANKCGATATSVCNPTWVKVSGPSLDCWGGDSGGPIFIGNVAVGLLSVATYKWPIAGTNPTQYYSWNASNMKGKGWCGGAAQPNGYMAYMSTDELYNQGYSLLYGQ